MGTLQESIFMQHRMTIMLMDKDDQPSDVIQIMIFTVPNACVADLADGYGLWNTDTNKVLLLEERYIEFLSCRTQKQQGEFFARLTKTSSRLLG
jgi:hypothetical protein